MNRFRIIGCCLIIFSLFSGCSQRLQIEEALQEEGSQLTREEIRRTLTGATVELTSWDELYEAQITFSPDGRLQAENEQGERDRGDWRLADDDRFCFKFTDWQPDQMTCYNMVGDDESYLLFGGSGGHDFSLEILAEANSEALLKPAISRSRPAPEEGEKARWYSFLFSGDGEREDTAAGDIEPEPLKAELRHLLEDNECVDCDLRGEDLAGADLDGADLEGANLGGAVLEGASLRDSNLEGADLSRANLKGADLRGAVLKNAVLAGADLELALLGEADLEGADLSGARLVDADLSEATLTRATLQAADLHWASLREANLAEADLKDAYLVKADFQEADLTGADLTGAVIQRTNFEGTRGSQPAAGENEPAEEEDSDWWIF